MSQPLPQSLPMQEVWLQVMGTGLITFPAVWQYELGMKNGSLIKAKREGNRVIIEPQAVKPTLSTFQLKAEFQQIERLYQLKNPEEVWIFLATHQYLVPLLIEAHKYVRKYFPTANLVLKYMPDPEAVNEEHLTLAISFEKDVDKAHDALEQFDQEWWLIAGDQADDDLCITLGDG